MSHGQSEEPQIPERQAQLYSIHVRKLRVRAIQDELLTIKHKMLELDQAEKALAQARENRRLREESSLKRSFVNEDENWPSNAETKRIRISPYNTEISIPGLDLHKTPSLTSSSFGQTNDSAIFNPLAGVDFEVIKRQTPSPPTASIDVAALLQNLVKANLITPPSSMCSSPSPPLSMSSLSGNQQSQTVAQLVSVPTSHGPNANFPGRFHQEMRNESHINDIYSTTSSRKIHDPKHASANHASQKTRKHPQTNTQHGTASTRRCKRGQRPNLANRASLQIRNESALTDLYGKPSMPSATLPIIHGPKPNLADQASLKIRNPSLIKALHSGVQCSNCCIRFDNKSTATYQKHLDEHFEENRRSRIEKSKGQEWYPNTLEWIKMQPNQKKDNKKEPNWFVKQQMQSEKNRQEESMPQINCVARDDKKCFVCSDPFEIFFDDDEEEWMLRNAIRIDASVYHPQCHADMTKEN